MCFKKQNYVSTEKTRLNVFNLPFSLATIHSQSYEQRNQGIHEYPLHLHMFIVFKTLFMVNCVCYIMHCVTIDTRSCTCFTFFCENILFEKEIAAQWRFAVVVSWDIFLLQSLLLSRNLCQSNSNYLHIMSVFFPIFHSQNKLLIPDVS